MSTFTVPVVKLGEVLDHPNADALSLTTVDGCPVICQKGRFATGDTAVYVPIDAVVPLDREYFAWLSTKEGQTTARVKAKKLRGIFSMGLLLRPDEIPGFAGEIGQDMAENLGVTKYEEPEEVSTKADSESFHGLAPVYDMESYRKFKHIFLPDERVIITEKLHGANARFVYSDGRLWVGSHRQFKKDGENIWWRMARKHDLENKLSKIPGMVLYAEVYGQVQDLKYDTKPGEIRLAAFDLFDPTQGKYMDWDQFEATMFGMDIPMVPVLYDGPHREEMVLLAGSGDSSIAKNIREGAVIKPAVERWNYETRRTIFKYVSEKYLLRKGGTEGH